MKKKFLSLLITVALVITSLDMVAYAGEMENDEASYASMENDETDNAAEQEEQSEQIGEIELANEIEVMMDEELPEDIMVKEKIKTIENVRKETFTENINDVDAMKAAIEIREETVEKEEAETIQNDNNGTQIRPDEKTDDQLSEAEETDGNIESSDKLIQTEEMETADADVAASYERISRVSRDDGTWLFPLSKSFWNSFTDWAGCPGYSKCSFCGTVHSSWGDEAHTGQSYGHNGFDIGAPIGTYVLAAASGTIVYTSIGNNGGRGNFVVIEHTIDGSNFSYYSYYQHLNSISVTKGASVSAGETIAKSGNSGIGTGAHLHFGIVMAQKGTNIGSRLYEIENKGWVTGSGNKEGRILVNPSTKQQNMPTGSSAVIPPLAYHSGSVTYTFDKNKVTVGTSLSPVASTLKITGQSSPGNLKTGERWTCTGTISSNYAITHVGGYILQSDHSTVAQSKTIKPNATSYSLANGEIDRALLFNELPQGTYYYKITAHDASGMRLTLIDDKFTVASPAPQPCNFSGQIISPVELAALNTSKVKVTASATDIYAINNFILRLYFNGNNIRTETIAASKSGTAYTCDYDFNLSEEGAYAINVTAVCANGATHSIGDRSFIYDATPPMISNLRAYEENGDFYCSANVSDSVTDVAYATILVKDEDGTEKSFECRKVNDIVFGIWSDISGLRTAGKYTIILYVQDNAGNVGHAALQDVVIAEVSSDPQRVDIVVGEEKEVNISVNTLFNTTLQVFNKKISYRTFQCIISLRQQLQRKVIPYDKLIIQQRKPDW